MIKELSSFWVAFTPDVLSLDLCSLIKMDERMLHGSQRSLYIQENLVNLRGSYFPIHHRI